MTDHLLFDFTVDRATATIHITWDGEPRST